MHADLAAQRQQLHVLYQFLLAVRTRKAQSFERTPPQMQQAEHVNSSRHEVCERPQGYTIGLPRKPPTLVMHELHNSTWGANSCSFDAALAS